MLTYVIPDIHGRADLLMAAIEGIERRSPEGGTIIFLGDYVDRGPDSKSVIDRLIKGPSDKWIWRFIRGNHEDMLLQCHNNTGSDFQWWASNGGLATIASYEDRKIDWHHLQWMKELPRLLWDEHRVYTHAGVDPSVPLEEQTETYTQWFRYPAGADIGWNDKHVVHGHTPIGPEMFTNRTNLDSGAVFTGIMHIGIFDDDIPGGPIEVAKVKP